MFSTTVAITVSDYPKIIRIATFGAHIFRALLHSAVRVMLAALATTAIGDVPSIVRKPALFTVIIHFVSFLKRNIYPFFQKSIQPTRILSAKFQSQKNQVTNDTHLAFHIFHKSSRLSFGFADHP